MSGNYPTVSERFAEQDTRFLTEVLGSKVVDQIMLDISDNKLSLKEVADRNGVRCCDVVQVCRFHNIDINGNTLTH